jgi:hypothetical protein
MVSTRSVLEECMVMVRTKQGTDGQKNLPENYPLSPILLNAIFIEINPHGK